MLYINLQIRHTINAVIKLIIVYTIVATKKFKLFIINVTIKKTITFIYVFEKIYSTISIIFLVDVSIQYIIYCMLYVLLS